MATPQYSPKSTRAINMLGKTIGELTVVSFAGSDENGRLWWNCQCSCGNTSAVSGKQFRRKNPTRSCGCLQKKRAAEAQFTHRKSNSRAYNIWQLMKDRCSNINCPHYAYYGGRGISVDSSWLQSFQQFISDMGEPPSETHTIDRIDNNGNYSPQNCRWATRLEQSKNQDRTHKFNYLGSQMTLSELSSISGIPSTTLYGRLVRYKWPLEKALTTPVKKRG